MKYGLIGCENYCNVFNNTHTEQNNRFKAHRKFDIKSNKPALKNNYTCASLP